MHDSKFNWIALILSWQGQFHYDASLSIKGKCRDVLPRFWGFLRIFAGDISNKNCSRSVLSFAHFPHLGGGEVFRSDYLT